LAKKTEKPTIRKIVIKKRKPEIQGICPTCGRVPLQFPCSPELHRAVREYGIEAGQKEAYKKAAIATIKKLRIINQEPIYKVLQDLRQYEEYLIRENNLTPEDVNERR